MANYESRKQLKKHLSNAIGYMKHDRTQFSLPTTVAFFRRIPRWFTRRRT